MLMSGLDSGNDFTSVVSFETWPVTPKSDFSPRAFRWAERANSARENLLHHLTLSFNEARSEAQAGASWKPDGRVGVILASTKGVTEDFVWSQAASADQRDPLSPLLDEMISRMAISVRERICISNACASSLAALAVAKTWLSAGRVDDVIVLACDAIDSFVLHGFHQLRVLTNERTRPFSAERSGFYLGDGAACLILSNRVTAAVSFIDARFDSEGYAVTRPSRSGESLLRACRSLEGGAQSTDLVIAHGTATRANDEVEDRVFASLFPVEKPPITGTKWLIGHTLGTCGLLDVICARAVLMRQNAFRLMTTPEVDPTFVGRYLTSIASHQPSKLETVLVTSLGFGGVHAAALVGLNPGERR
jgi:3-oxoacyl-[acyl-carrier-protein] synthase-1